MSFSYSLTSHGRGDDVTSFPPEMDDAMLEDRLEQARQNRTNYYRRMIASRTRPMEDHLVTRKSTTSYTGGGGGGSGSGGGSISDTSGTVPVPKIPQPHCSWRFYTSYDNGEWKRHAVPVDHDVDEILREPTNTPRRERDKVSPPHSSYETSSSIRRARQAGGPLVACLQPRAKRISESSNGGVATTTTSRTVGLSPSGGQVINGLDAQLAGQLGPAELMNLYGNEELVRQILEGGGGLVVGFDGENHPPGGVKQEFSSKYMSTVTVTQPTGGGKTSGAQGEGGTTADVAKLEGSDGAGVPKSRRPRIYGFQEKIIIPTKYKTSVENQENDVTASKTDSVSHHSGSKVNQETVKVNGVLPSPSGGTGDVKTETRVVSTLRSSPGRTRTTPETQTVKVVVVNSGSDAESERRSEEPRETDEEEQKKGGELAEAVQKEPGVKKEETFVPFVMKEGLTPMENFQAFQESFRRQFENSSGVEKKDEVVEKTDEEKKASSSTSHPGQRLFSKDEQTFSDVGPDGQKRDGKVVSTYEVVTTTTTAAADGDPASPPKGEEGPLSIKEIPITPVGPVRSQLAAISFTPAERRRSDDGVAEIARGTSPFSGGGGGHRSDPVRSQKTVEIVREQHGAGGRSPAASRRMIVEESSSSSLSSPKSEERRGVRASGAHDVSIFDQTGSLFKQISPRPRAERKREFASPRDTRQWSRDQGLGGGGGGGGGGYTGRAATTATAATSAATRTWTDGSAEQPQGSRRKVVIVREMDTVGGGSDEGQCSAVSSQKAVEVVLEGDGEPAGHHHHHHSSIAFREPDEKADQSGTRTTVKIVRETGTPSGTAKTSWESGSEISSLEGATSSESKVLFASSSKGKESPDPVRLSSSTTKQSIRTGDADISAEQWEVQVAVKD